MGKYTDELNETLKQGPGYHRALYQSYMTAPEWRNVEISEDFAKFMREGRSMFQFPYFSQIFGLWRILFQAYGVSRQHDSDYHILTSEYMVMDLFVTIFTTGELIPKAFVSLLLYPFLAKENQTEMQTHLAEYFETYYDDILSGPFYNHDFKKHREALALKYKACQKKTWGDWFTWTFVSTELWVKSWISAVVKYTMAPGPNEAPTPMTTDVLVKMSIDENRLPEGELTAEAAKQCFKEKFNLAVSTFESAVAGNKRPEDDMHLIDDVYVKDKKAGQSSMAVYARITTPRYTDFPKAVVALAEQGIFVRKIAGQDQVQVKCEINAPDARGLLSVREKINQTSGATPLYTYGDGIHTNRQFCLFDVSAKNIHDTLKQLEAPITERSTSKVTFVHNF